MSGREIDIPTGSRCGHDRTETSLSPTVTDTVMRRWDSMGIRYGRARDVFGLNRATCACQQHFAYR